jgi:hypothetical protein
MHILRHLCGQALERQVLERSNNPPGTYYHLIPGGAGITRAVRVERCPCCNELLDDTDIIDRTGAPLALDTLPAWGVARRAVLAGLAAAGYTLRWADGAWHIRHTDQAADTASASTLDAMIELAQAIITGTDPGGDAPMAA